MAWRVLQPELLAGAWVDDGRWARAGLRQGGDRA